MPFRGPGAIRDHPRDWVGSRAVPSDKRARQRAAREARLAEEARRQKRRKQIRNAVLVVVAAGAIVGIAFAVSSGSNGSKSATTTTTAPKGANAKLQAQANEVAVKAGCPASATNPTRWPPRSTRRRRRMTIDASKRTRPRS